MLYYDGRHYDRRKHPADDVTFWEKQAHKYGAPVLELACGTGRVTIPLAKAGYEITGLDVLTSMLDEARMKAAREAVDVSWVEADCRDFDLGRKYSLVFIPYNSMNHIETVEDLEACFRCVRKHMGRDSRFVFDILNPRLDILLRDPVQEYPHSVYEHPDGLGQIKITENNVYDPATQINIVRLYHVLPDGSKSRYDLVLRMWYPQEIDAIVKYNGFVMEKKYGNYDESPFRGDSPKQIAVCRKAG